MIKVSYFVIIMFIFLEYGCRDSIKKVKINIKNNSDVQIDSFKVSLNKPEVVINDVLFPQEKTSLLINSDSTNKKSGVFFIKYYTKNGSFWAGFGYHSSKAFLKDSYSVYIFNEGVSEINKSTPFLKENKHKIN